MKKTFGSVTIALGLAITTAASAADIIVSAAVSLSNAFNEIGKEYEKANPGDKVLFNFGASGQLLQQISRGAPADVFASADQETMNRAAAQNLIVRDTRKDFVSNTLVAIVPVSSPSQLKSMDDLAGTAVKRIGIGTPESVPAGRYAKEALEIAGQWDKLKDKYIFGQNVRQVLDYVARNEVDAGFVYASDAATASGKIKPAFTATLKTPILYPIAAVRGSGSENLARSFIDFVQSESSRKILDRYGFGRP